MNDPNERDPLHPPGPRNEERGMPTWGKVVLWILVAVVGLPVLGLMLLFGYCAMAVR